MRGKEWALLDRTFALEFFRCEFYAARWRFPLMVAFANIAPLPSDCLCRARAASWVPKALERVVWTRAIVFIVAGHLAISIRTRGQPFDLIGRFPHIALGRFALQGSCFVPIRITKALDQSHFIHDSPLSLTSAM